MLASGMLLAAILACLSAMVLMSVWNQNFWKLPPPGPNPLPLIGNFLQLDTGDMYNALMKLQKKYGNVFTVYLGPRPVVILCGHDAVKEALVDQADDFSGHGEIATIEQNFHNHGLVMANGERWKVLRRFSLTVLRNFGMGKRSIEERIQEEAGYLLEEFRKTKGTPIDPTFFLSCTVSNVISSVVFGNRFDYEDKQFLSLLGMINETFIEMSVPWAQDKKDPHTEFNLRNLVLTTLNLFFAGTETVSSTLRYGMLLLMKYPQVEAKVQEEIIQVIGPHWIPTVDERIKMPYMDAVIHEIQRLTDIVPLGVPHTVVRDTHFRGYFLPKGIDVYPLLGSVLRDPKYFQHPNDFYPQHFLDEQGHFKKNDAFVAFSSGKRICVGESLALMELFLYFTSIFQNFSFSSLVPPADIDITPRISGFGNIPPSYKLCLVAR
ncbi:LOW QUALITY PROTEIN: cytochrome P450 2G1-like [Dipodomys merriami]|uniref:LOW QUALITY PROTEIN: cytochrome P450 2G1-like n=1 Tax=Dipodomys merriami TaxID=94247 RepID=UPI0038559436